MKEREAASLAAAGICLFPALLRMLAPEIPFDWMTLALLLAAAAAVLIGALAKRALAPPSAAAEEAGGVSFIPGEMDALRMRMAQTDWETKEGGLFAALLTLHRDKPFAALCAARGVLYMLLRQAKLSPEAAATTALLSSALDAMAERGESAADPGTVDALFSYSLRAIGHLESVS